MTEFDTLEAKFREYLRRKLLPSDEEIPTPAELKRFQKLIIQRSKQGTASAPVPVVIDQADKPPVEIISDVKGRNRVISRPDTGSYQTLLHDVIAKLNSRK